MSVPSEETGITTDPGNGVGDGVLVGALVGVSVGGLASAVAVPSTVEVGESVLVRVCVGGAVEVAAGSVAVAGLSCSTLAGIVSMPTSKAIEQDVCSKVKKITRNIRSFMVPPVES